MICLVSKLHKLTILNFLIFPLVFPLKHIINIIFYKKNKFPHTQSLNSTRMLHPTLFFCKLQPIPINFASLFYERTNDNKKDM